MRKDVIASIGAVGLAATVALFNLNMEDVNLFYSEDSQIITAEERHFFDFIAQYGRSYGTKAEYKFRLDLFKKKLAVLDKFNANPNKTSTVGVNEFTDWTDEEFKKKLGYVQKKFTQTKVEILDESNLAGTVDWRSKGAVTPVKNQGDCGSCWAFSTTGAMEGAYQIKHGILLSFSEQELLDCDTYDDGCNGGNMDIAFDWLSDNKLETESDYPYTAKKGSCQYSKSEGKVSTTDTKEVTSNSPSQLKAALNVGPVSVGIEADKPVFQHYTDGIITDASCGTKLDHGVLAVGYGEDYFLVKNSWGPQWAGLGGYVKIGVADGAGICGIQTWPAYPIL